MLLKGLHRAEADRDEKNLSLKRLRQENWYQPGL